MDGGAAARGWMNCAVFVGVVGVEGSRNRHGIVAVVVVVVDVAVVRSPGAPVAASPDCK